jgi:4-hydroxybenzoate polyprenyltransferase
MTEPELAVQPPPTARSEAPSTRGQLGALLRSLRPRQWLKNLIVFAPLVFAARLLDLEAVFRALAAFFLFCAIAGGLYLLNDLVDLEADRRHPVKRNRPLASGKLSPRLARIALLVIWPGALVGAALVDPDLGLLGVLLLYMAINVGYSLLWKHVVLVDVFLVAAGFVLRAFAGGAVIDVDISRWLVLCTLFLALFLALGKRRHELTTLTKAHEHRPILVEYSARYIDQMLAILCAVTVSAYSLYTIDGATIAKFGTDRLIYTVPLVLFGIFRYLYLIYRREGGDRPEEALLTDRPLLVSVACWGLLAAGIIYTH